ncbi:hexokinase-1, partial [Diplocarpon rosae]
MATSKQSPFLDSFLRPLQIDIPKIHSLARSLCETFTSLAAESEEQFLPTPISESLLRPEQDQKGSGGTNLRVGFVELLGSGGVILEDAGAERDNDYNDRSRAQCHLEKSWPIGEPLKNDKAEDLFKWIGECIAEVVQDGCRAWPGELSEEIALGVTFSFPMIQHTLSDAEIMSMGKGFQITNNLDLGKLLSDGYDNNRDPTLPRIKITAIVNDAVATLVSFAHTNRSDARRKAAMGLIVGTGCNATITLPISKLHPSKRPAEVKVRDDSEVGQDLRIAVNTEWAIKGAAGPLRALGFISAWDEKLDAEGEVPGFQPFEYMTSGRYLGELGRIIIVDFLTSHLSVPKTTLPPRLVQRNGLSTTFLGNLGPRPAATEPSILNQLEQEFPPSNSPSAWLWTPESASFAYSIAKAIQTRAAGMVAAAVIALLTARNRNSFLEQTCTWHLLIQLPSSACAEEIHLSTPGLPHGRLSPNRTRSELDEIMVGYTGSCIVHFQDYLEDCQRFMDEIIKAEFRDREDPPKVVLRPCHEGGIIGAGILVGTVQ